MPELALIEANLPVRCERRHPRYPVVSEKRLALQSCSCEEGSASNKLSLRTKEERMERALLSISTMIQWYLLMLMLPPCAFHLGITRQCPWKKIRDRNAFFNYYRPGDYQITGIITTANSIFWPYHFYSSPSHNDNV